ncbi:hypothetical protein [Paenibacillus terrae]|uniref:hypothetical protein n=1 Tax=Paenibacillus terrae TaxID=159743 RepID=UPI0010BE8E81|nr:hypothetical protein [Paenibacillus terrae]
MRKTETIQSFSCEQPFLSFQRCLEAGILEPLSDLADGTYTVEGTAEKDGKASMVSKELTIDTTNNSMLTGLQFNGWNGNSVGLSPVFNTTLQVVNGCFFSPMALYNQNPALL